MTTTTRKERRKCMAPLSEDDVDRIAEKVKEKIASSFDLDPQYHYDLHKDLEEMAASFNGARSIFTKVFVTAVAIGGVILAGWSMFGKKVGG